MLINFDLTAILVFLLVPHLLFFSFPFLFCLIVPVDYLAFTRRRKGKKRTLEGKEDFISCEQRKKKGRMRFVVTVLLLTFGACGVLQWYTWILR